MSIERMEVATYKVPTDRPEADGTLAWDSTTVVVVHAFGDGHVGMGFTYGPKACATLITEVLESKIVGGDPMASVENWEKMVRAIRNDGRPGIASMAIAAVDTALWDLKAKLLNQALCDVLGTATAAVPVYGSGGFTSYTDDELTQQLSGWVHNQNIPRVKMKIGTDWGTKEDVDVKRVELARRAIGDDAQLYVDANGAYTRKQAVRLATRFADLGVTWFEEPVSSDDLDGLTEIRAMTPIDIAAGEYGYDLAYFQRMSNAGAVDVVQADVTRCAGITEWMRIAALAASNGLDISGHCAPSLHLHPAAAVPNLRHLEYFHDHVRIERLLFDGAIDPVDGALHPDRGSPGTGLYLRQTDAEQYRIG